MYIRFIDVIAASCSAFILIVYSNPLREKAVIYPFCVDGHLDSLGLFKIILVLSFGEYRYAFLLGILKSRMAGS